MSKRKYIEIQKKYQIKESIQAKIEVKDYI